MTKNRDTLDEYRRRWTEDDPDLRGRYTTELIREQIKEGETTRRYLPPTIRKNPGAPLVIDKIRKIIIDKYGSVNTESMYKVFDMNDEAKSGKMDLKTFRISLADCGVRIDDFQYDNLVRFFDRKKEGIIDYNEFISYYE